MKYYLGIDGGGSKTLATICDENGREVARSITGGSNHQINKKLAEENLAAAVDQVLSAAQLSRSNIASAVFGLAGADRETDFKILRPIVKKLGFETYEIVCDTHIGLRAGTDHPYGVVLICGTGTNALGTNKEHQSFQCGGFGYLYGDWGGGSALANEVFRSVIRAWDGREIQTEMTQLVLDYYNYDSVDEMHDDFLDHAHSPALDLTKVLFEVAETDAVAQDLLRQQGVALGKAAKSIILRLGMDYPFDIVLVGSVLTKGDANGTYISPYILKEIEDVYQGGRLVHLDKEPAMGALLLAMENDGVEVSDSIYEEMEQSYLLREDTDE